MYSGTSDWANLYEGIEDYWEGTGSQALINNVGTRANKLVNSRLLAIGIRAPVGTIEGGGYDQELVDWESWWAIYTLLVRRHRGEWDTEQPEWVSAIWGEGSRIYDDLGSRTLVLEHQRSPFESGIGTPAADSDNAGSALFHTNWEGYGGYYTGTDYRRDYVIEVTGTGTSTNLTQGTYRWSRDGGLSWMGTGSAMGTDWRSLGSNVYIRWEYVGSLLGQAEIGDKWTFSTWPKHLEVQAKAADWRTREILIR